MIVTDAACLSTSGIYFAFWHITSLSFFSLFCHPDPIIPIAENTLLSFLCGQKSEPNWFIHSYLIPHVIKDICLVFSRHFSKFWAREVIVSPRAEGVGDRMTTDGWTILCSNLPCDRLRNLFSGVQRLAEYTNLKGLPRDDLHLPLEPNHI